MVKITRSKFVPKSMQAAYDAITGDAFCRVHLNDGYLELARDMAAALVRKRPSPVAPRQPRTWASGTIYTLGQINFLSDKSFEPYMTIADVCAGFGDGQSTASAKAKIISRGLPPHSSEPNFWSIRSTLEQRIGRIRVCEVRRSELIDKMDLRAVQDC